MAFFDLVVNGIQFSLASPFYLSIRPVRSVHRCAHAFGDSTIGRSRAINGRTVPGLSLGRSFNSTLCFVSCYRVTYKSRLFPVD